MLMGEIKGHGEKRGKRYKFSLPWKRNKVMTN
jgi:hypothetical protein